MKIKRLPYAKQWIDKIDISEVVNVLKSDFLTQGPKIEEFEKALTNYVDAKYAVAVSSGTAALHLACLAMGINPDDEIIIPTLSFVATANCVLYCGAKPILVDVYTDTLTINIEEAESKISKKTKAIIAVDFAGHPASWDKLKKLAKKYNLVLIDDAAHSLGSKHKSKMIGSIADLTCFSFHPAKIITAGEGGAITTNNKTYFEKLKKLRHHGIYKSNILNKKFGSWYYQINELGYNYRMNDIQATLGISQLKKIDKFIEKRRKIWHKYNQALGKINGLIVPKEKQWCFCAWHIYTIRLNSKVLGINRRKIFEKLQNGGLGIQIHYLPIHMFNLYQKRFGYKTGAFPTAEQYYKETISLPLFPKMTITDVNFVIKTFRNIINKYTARQLKAFNNIKKTKDPKISPDIDAVVVLSGESGGSVPGTYQHDTQERVNFGIALFKKIEKLGRSPTFILSGTNHQNILMKKMAKNAGINKIVLIKNLPYPFASTDTQIKGLAKLHFTKLAIVTHAWHGVRTKLTAEKRLPRNVFFQLFLLERNKINNSDLESEIGKIQKYFSNTV